MKVDFEKILATIYFDNKIFSCQLIFCQINFSFTPEEEMSSFHVDARITVKLEYELAMRLGEFILSSGTEDKQFLALGHKLVNIEEDENENVNMNVGQRRNNNFEDYFGGVKSEPSYSNDQKDWAKNNPPIKIIRRSSKLVRKES